MKKIIALSLLFAVSCSRSVNPTGELPYKMNSEYVAEFSPRIPFMNRYKRWEVTYIDVDYSGKVLRISFQSKQKDTTYRADYERKARPKYSVTKSYGKTVEVFDKNGKPMKKKKS